MLRRLETLRSAIRHGGRYALLALLFGWLVSGCSTADKQPLKALSVSGGVAEYPYHGRDAQSLLHAADEALYEAKRQGRNRVAAAATAKAATPSPMPKDPATPTGAVRSA